MKVTFDGINRLILVNTGVTYLDVEADLYSAWKKWVQQGNLQYPQALRVVGGDPITGGKFVAPFFFLTNGWKIRPWEGDHTLVIDGNLFVDEQEKYGDNPVVPTLGGYTVTVIINVTSDARLLQAAMRTGRFMKVGL